MAADELSQLGLIIYKLSFCAVVQAKLMPTITEDPENDTWRAERPYIRNIRGGGLSPEICLYRQ